MFCEKDNGRIAGGDAISLSLSLSLKKAFFIYKGNSTTAYSIWNIKGSLDKCAVTFHEGTFFAMPYSVFFLIIIYNMYILLKYILAAKNQL